MDLSMPVMNGLEAARVLKRLIPNITLILFSDYSGAFTQRAARAAGIAALISKAQNANTVVVKARDVLDQDSA
jgi:DNA-binding NarL/FixJ family response regulator